MKKLWKEKKAAVIIGSVMFLVVIASFTTGVLCRNYNAMQKETKEQVTYQSLSESDKEIATIYAKLYEMSQEEVAKIHVKAKTWDKTADELEREFFTIPENVKYQMTKQGYSLEDLNEAEKLSAKTGRKAIELIKAKGKPSDNRSWSDVLNKEQEP